MAEATRSLLLVSPSELKKSCWGKKLYLPEILLSFAFLVNFGLGLLVYLKTESHPRINSSFSLLAWSAAGWALSFFMVYFLKDNAVRLFWGRMGFATSSFIPASFVIFAFLFPREQRPVNLTKLVLFYLPALLFFVLSFTGQIVSSLGTGSTMFNYGPIYLFYSIYITGFIVLGFSLLMKTFQKAVDSRQTISTRILRFHKSTS